MMEAESSEGRVAVLVDCDNVQPEIVEHALRFVAQFGRVVVRRGYGNPGTLAGRWKDTLVELAFTPCLQYQYASGKNTADIALALDAMELLFDERVDTFCLVTSDSDFAYLCRKLRERGSVLCIAGEAKTPKALRNASDHFFEWSPEMDSGDDDNAVPEKAEERAGPKRTDSEDSNRSPSKRRPRLIVNAVSMLAGDASDGTVDLGALGNYLRRTNPDFSPKTYGHSGLLDMLRSYDLLEVQQAAQGQWRVGLAKKS